MGERAGAEEKAGGIVNKLKTLPWTQLLLFAIALFLLMNWWQMRAINRNLNSLNVNTDVDLTQIQSAIKDIDSDLSH